MKAQELKDYIEKMDQKDKAALANTINHYGNVEINGVKLLSVYRGMDALNSNIYQYVFKVDGTDNHVKWESGYTSWDNGGPDGEVDTWSLENIVDCELNEVSVLRWEGINGI